MAEVVFSEVLCFSSKNIKGYDKNTLLDIASAFFTKINCMMRKMNCAKLWCRYRVTLPNPTAGRRLTATRVCHLCARILIRFKEADDVMQMMLILNVNNVILSKFVIADPDRVPNGVWAVTTSVSSEIGMLMSAV